MAAVLFWSGIAFELLGLALVGAPDYVPLAKGLGAAVERRLGPLWARLLRLVGLRRSKIIQVESAGELNLSGRASAVVSKGENASLEENVAFLLEQATQTQERLNKTESTIADLPKTWRADIATARDELEQRIERRLTETQERYLGARRVGLICLLLGVALVTASNLV